MSHKTTAATYAQMRRDIEAAVRDTLKARIPKPFLTQEIELDGTLNQTAKVMTAARNFIESLDSCCDEISSSQETLTADKVIVQEKINLFLIPTMLGGEQPEVLRQLRQAAQRLVHKVEEHIQCIEEIPQELHDCIEKAGDTLIDLIAEIECTATGD